MSQVAKSLAAGLMRVDMLSAYHSCLCTSLINTRTLSPLQQTRIMSLVLGLDKKIGLNRMNVENSSRPLH